MNSEENSPLNAQNYLWAVGLDAGAFPAGTLLNNRYRVIGSQVVTDTQSFKLPEAPDEIPTYAISYLKLSRLPLHLPRPYGLVRWGSGLEISEVLLLESAPIAQRGELCPTLAESWAQATTIRQINWLWQVLHLWEPLADQNMTMTLLQPEFVRVDGSWVRLLELQADVRKVELSELGDLWVKWLPDDHAAVTEEVAEFCYALARGAYDLSAAIAQLDALALSQFQKLPLTIRSASATDKGPRRDHNEDTCYPDPKRSRAQLPEILRDRVGVICDGLGGHEGGEVASTMAIKTLEQQLQILLRQVEMDTEPFVPETFAAQLEAIVRVVNNQIVALNDTQHRQAQQRMGTTLVMAIAPRPHGQNSPEIYFVHVGDSRAYWIGKDNFFQVTVDDDVATRETVLGYNFPAYSSQRIDSGALIQALGTRPSETMVPRVQRLLLDEDCLILLCSDGLSDFDRVNEIYQGNLRPILMENIPLEQAAQTLIDRANTLNGHDNSTVVLLRFRLAPPDPEPGDVVPDATTIPIKNETDLNLTEIATAPIKERVDAAPKPGNSVAGASQTASKSAEAPERRQSQSKVMILGLVLVALIAGMGVVFWRYPQIYSQLKTWVEHKVLRR